MEIEIVTTKMKLSNSIIKQFARIKPQEIEGAECIGYVLNIIKDNYKTYIIKLRNGEYRMLEYSWFKLSEETPKMYRRLKKGTLHLEFEDIKQRDLLQTFLNECDKTSQIFI